MEAPQIDHKLLAEQERGRQAAELLEHPLMKEAFSTIRQEFTQAWQNSPARDQEGREKLWQLLKLTDRLESFLTETVTTGKMATMQIEEAKTLAQRMKDGLSSFFG